MENNTVYKVDLDETDILGLRVKILLPTWLEPKLNANQLIRVFTTHHPNLDPASSTTKEATKWRNLLL